MVRFSIRCSLYCSPGLQECYQSIFTVSQRLTRDHSNLQNEWNWFITGVCNYASCLNLQLCERKQQISTNICFEQNTKGKGHYELVRLSHANRVFHKPFTIQECQYCQLSFGCAIRKKLDEWSLQPWNVILLCPLISIFTFTDIISCK